MNDVASTEEDPLLGEVVDERFRLDRKLGEGAVGRVYRATQLSIDRPVAIKVLHGEFRRDDEYQERFHREARSISSFNHPNIVRLVDYGEDDEKGLTYLAMEYVEGLELYDINEKGRLDPRCALEITSQVAAGLSAAHEAEIVHRDLKASNIILVSVPGGIFQAKVLDFGVAFPKNQSKRMTTDGEVFGTPAYMSPEQARGEAVDIGSDIYSLGIVLYEMLTGDLPFAGENTVELMVKHLQNKPPPLSAGLAGGDVPEGLQQLITNLLAKDPAARPPNGDAVRDRIEEIRNRNGWGALHVDSHLGLEEALEKWVLPEHDRRLTTEQQTGRPGSDRQDSLSAQDRRTAVGGEGQRSSNESENRLERESPVENTAASSQPIAAGGETRDSQQARAASPGRDQTTLQTASYEPLKLAVIVLCLLALLVGGGLASVLIFGGSSGGGDEGARGGEGATVTAGSAPEDARSADASLDGSSADTGPTADSGDAGADSAIDTAPPDARRRAASDESDDNRGGGRESDPAPTSSGTPSSPDDETDPSGSRPPRDPDPPPTSTTTPGGTSGSDDESAGGGGDSEEESADDESPSDEGDEIDKKLKNQLEQLDQSEF